MSKYLLRQMVSKLEELFQCSICYNVPNGSVFNCPSGHSVCETCYRGLHNCPSCDKPYHKRGGGSRNFALESILEYHRDVLSNFVQGNDNEDSDSSDEASNSNSNHRQQQQQSTGQAALKITCPYEKNGCRHFSDNGKVSQARMLQMVKHTRECPYRPIECLVQPRPGWRHHTTNELKRFCGPSEEQREEDRIWAMCSSVPLYEKRSVTQEIPWENYIQHLQAEHGASFCFERFQRGSTSLFRTMDAIYAPNGLRNSNFTWPLQLINIDDKVFLRQQWIHKGEIQNRIFLFDAFDDYSYIATVKVSKVIGNTQRTIEMRTINVLSIRHYGLELLKLDTHNPRHDYSVMDTSYAERYYNVEGHGLQNNPTFAWYTWLEFQKKFNTNPIPFNTVPNLVERSQGGLLFQKL